MPLISSLCSKWIFLCKTLIFCFLPFLNASEQVLFLSEAFFPYVECNIVINPFLISLIEDLVAHARIELAFYVQITCVAHILHCFCEMAHIDHTGIVCAAYKKHRHFRLCAVPVLHIVGSLHQLEKCQVAIVCESKAAQLRIGILLCCCLIGSDPGGTVLVLTKTHYISAKGQGLDHMASVSRAENSALRMGQCHP